MNEVVENGTLDAPPTFLVGAERSGTTLLRLMLDHHPDVTWVNEFGYAVDWVPKEGWPELTFYYQELGKNRAFNSSGLTINRDLDYVGLVNDFLIQWCRRAGKSIVGAQVHRQFKELLRIWPNARFIHLVRDPRDVARSRINMGWAGNTWHATQVWIDAERQWADARLSVPKSRQLDIHFEELVRAPERDLTRVCDLMSIRFEPSMLEYYRDTTYAPVDRKLCEQWRTKLTKKEIRLVEADASEMMLERGYSLSGLPRMKVGNRLRSTLMIQDRLSRAAFRANRLGAALWLADVISRRTGPKTWRKQVIEKIQAVDEAHLK